MPQPDPFLLASVRRLALPDSDVVVGPGSLMISDHAVQRYRERVERVPRKLAGRRLDLLACSATWTARPRSWTRVVLHPKVIYGYSSVRPDVCLLVRGGVLVTVLSRRFLGESGTPGARSAA